MKEKIEKTLATKAKVLKLNVGSFEHYQHVLNEITHPELNLKDSFSKQLEIERDQKRAHLSNLIEILAQVTFLYSLKFLKNRRKKKNRQYMKQFENQTLSFAKQ